MKLSNFKLIQYEGGPKPEDLQPMTEGMLAYHASKGHVRKKDSYSIFIRDQDNKTIGGVVVTFLWNGMEIDSLWVDESTRGQGLGRKLMEMAEAEGKKRGCTIAYTNTFTWQAPDFYKKLDYTMYGEIPNFPEGNSLTYWQKSLI